MALFTTPRLTELERLAGPSVPYYVTTHRGFELLGIYRRRAGWYALTTPDTVDGSRGAVLTIETGAEFQIGPTNYMSPSPRRRG